MFILVDQLCYVLRLVSVPINQNLYFDCFEIISLFFGILFLFSIIILKVLFSF